MIEFVIGLAIGLIPYALHQLYSHRHYLRDFPVNLDFYEVPSATPPTPQDPRRDALAQTLRSRA